MNQNLPLKNVPYGGQPREICEKYKLFLFFLIQKGSHQVRGDYVQKNPQQRGGKGGGGRL